MIIEADEVAFWQAAYVAALRVLEGADTEDLSLLDSVRVAALGADEAVRQLRARRTAALEGGPEPAGIDPPKDAT